MAKGKYRAEKVESVSRERLMSALEVPHVVFAVDVAKKAMVGGFSVAEGTFVKVIRWSHPEQTPLVMGWVAQLSGAGRRVDVVLEPTGTYGDSLRQQAELAGAKIFRVGALRSHKHSESLDGVASWHDVKSVYVLEDLHRRKRSEPWRADPPERRQGRALVHQLELYARPLAGHQGRLEAVLASHWPELGDLVGIGSKSVLVLLCKYGGPAAVAADGPQAEALLGKVSRAMIDPAKAHAIVESAGRTLGVPMVAEEVQYVKMLAQEMLRLTDKAEEAERRLKKQLQDHPSVRAMTPLVGALTAAVLVAIGCDPAGYGSVRQYLKALGLNLRQHSSGKHAGKHRLSKRGNATGRRYLFLSTLRLLRSCMIAWAWHTKHGGLKGQRLKSAVALMRKLAKALWHVARGSPFDAAKLFDTRKLDLNVAPPKRGGRKRNQGPAVLVATQMDAPAV